VPCSVKRIVFWLYKNLVAMAVRRVHARKERMRNVKSGNWRVVWGWKVTIDTFILRKGRGGEFRA
jgi:hypothetical protein